MPSRLNWQRVRSHRSYSIDEAARLLGVNRQTVRRWIKDKGLPTLDGNRPTLILGRELKAHRLKVGRPKKRCGIDQAYCFRCQDISSALDEAWTIADAVGTAANMSMTCIVCGQSVFKRVSWRRLQLLSTKVRISARLRLRHLIETRQPCVNVHYLEDD